MLVVVGRSECTLSCSNRFHGGASVPVWVECYGTAHSGALMGYILSGKCIQVVTVWL